MLKTTRQANACVNVRPAVLSTRSFTRQGFTLPEVLVTLAIIAALTVAVVPSLFSKLREGRATSIMSSLASINEAVGEFRKGVGRYPGKLTLLVTAPTALVDTDACGTVYSTAAAALWRGPFLTRNFPSTGIAFDDALMYSGVRRSPTTVASPAPAIAHLIIDVGNVELAAVNIIDKETDNSDGATAGTIRYTSDAIPAQTGAGVNQTAEIPAALADRRNLSYYIPISGSGC